MKNTKHKENAVRAPKLLVVAAKRTESRACLIFSFFLVGFLEKQVKGWVNFLGKAEDFPGKNEEK